MRILWLIPLLMLTGCADSSTKGDSNLREYKDLVVIRDNPGTVNLTVNLSASSDQETATKQDTKNSSSIDPKTSVGLNGGSAALATDGAEFMMEGMSSLFQQWQDNRKTDSDNPISSETTNNTTTETVEAEIVEEDLTEETETVVDNDDVAYQTKYHHTQTNGTDGGQSLVLCPDQDIMFDSCSAGDVNIPYHGKDEGRLSFWNMTEYSTEDIICLKDGVKYKYPVTEGMAYGDC